MMRPIRRGAGAAAAGLLLLAAHAHDPAEAQQIDAGRLTMEIEEQPLADVLNRIARTAGAELSIEGELGPAEPQIFDRVPLDVAVRQLVGAHSVIMIHKPGAVGGLTEIRVYAVDEDPEARRQASLRQARQAARTTRSDDGASGGQVDRRERAARVQEVRELARSDDPAAAGELVRILESDTDPAIRRLAIGALSGLDDPGASDAIAGALGDEDRAVRVQAVRALHNLLGDEVAPYLAQIVASDDDVAVRMMVVQMAADLQGGPAAEVLERALDDPDEEIRQMAEDALDR